MLSGLPLAGRGLARYRAGVAVSLLALGALIMGLAPAWPVVLLAAVPLSLRVAPPALVLGALRLACIVLELAHLPALAPLMLAALGGRVAVLFPNTLTWRARALPGAGGGTALVIAGALLGGAVFPVLIGQAAGVLGARAIPGALLALSALALAVGLWLWRRTGQLG